MSKCNHGTPEGIFCDKCNAEYNESLAPDIEDITNRFCRNTIYLRQELKLDCVNVLSENQITARYFLKDKVLVVDFVRDEDNKFKFKTWEVITLEENTKGERERLLNRPQPKEKEIMGRVLDVRKNDEINSIKYDDQGSEITQTSIGIDIVDGEGDVIMQRWEDIDNLIIALKKAKEIWGPG